ncbi:helix-turn-helix transcriptional regulator [Caballeronia sp. dw_19]|jgi:DNA-binding XRE family transcriptional regulator|uniref:helix-turn-helix domain-containing protein n=1 Tax=unclassified Caballeronia TaxID=2646786 RepID=UPI001BD698DB|nr:helix-turn-helix transcriptional regulator [Caballeronia sp. dw_19]
MNARTNIQVINGPDGKPAFVVIPYAEYVQKHREETGLIPHDVVSRTVDGASPVRAWREHLNLTQADMAIRLGISQPAYSEQESGQLRLRKATKEKIAASLGITLEQLDF